MSEYINRTTTVVDLGCGTGLVGKCFSALVREKSHERSLLEVRESGAERGLGG